MDPVQLCKLAEHLRNSWCLVMSWVQNLAAWRHTHTHSYGLREACTHILFMHVTQYSVAMKRRVQKCFGGCLCDCRRSVFTQCKRDGELETKGATEILPWICRSAVPPQEIVLDGAERPVTSWPCSDLLRIQVKSGQDGLWCRLSECTLRWTFSLFC